MKVFKKVFNTVINILIIAVLVISVLVATLALTSKSSGVSNILGYTVQVIVSDSMAGGSTEYEGGNFQKGDIIIGKVTNNEKVDTPETYKEGDIVTFKGILQGNADLGEQLICHRIIDVQERNGEIVYQTQGDNHTVSEIPDQNSVDEYITAYSIVAKFYTDDFQGIKIEGAGKFYEFISSQLGFFLCILLPMIIFFLYVLITVVVNFVEYKKAKEDEEKEKNAPEATAPQMSAEEYEEFKKFQEMKNALSSQADDESAENPHDENASSKE